VGAKAAAGRVVAAPEVAVVRVVRRTDLLMGLALEVVPAAVVPAAVLVVVPVAAILTLL
jgi:hypothetical protein